VLLSGYLRKHGVLSKISEQVRFARRRFGRYEVIDFLAVLLGSSLLLSRSWPCLSVIGCPPVRRSHAFWRH
jgi:hypothetical protein